MGRPGSVLATLPSSRSTPRWSSNYAGWSTSPPKPKPAAGYPNGSTNTTGTPGEAPAVRAGHAQPDRDHELAERRQNPGCGRQQPAITETSQKNSHTTTIPLGEVSTVAGDCHSPGGYRVTVSRIPDADRRRRRHRQRDHHPHRPAQRVGVRHLTVPAAVGAESADHPPAEHCLSTRRRRRRNDYRAQIPFVPPDTCTATLNHIVMAQ